MPTTFHYLEIPFGRTYADVITKISRMDSLPNYLSYGAPLARASRARSFAKNIVLKTLKHLYFSIFYFREVELENVIKDFIDRKKSLSRVKKTT